MTLYVGHEKLYGHIGHYIRNMGHFKRDMGHYKWHKTFEGDGALYGGHRTLYARLRTCH